MEGQRPGTVVILEFPSLQAAHGWYASPAYQQILPLRTRHIDGDTLIFPGVGPGYDPRHKAEALRADVA